MKKIPDKVIVAAVKASARSNLVDYHLGACVYKDNKIISTGFNRAYHCGKPCYLPAFGYSIHAEEDALFGLPRQITYGASIFIYREGNNLAKPCSRCQKAISRAGISHIYYSPI